MTNRTPQAVSDTIQAALELTTRIDERVHMLLSKQKDLDLQVGKLIDMQNQTHNRLSIMESKYHEADADIARVSESVTVMAQRVHTLEMKVENSIARISGHDTRWVKIFDGAWKVSVMILGSYILYKLGLPVVP